MVKMAHKALLARRSAGRPGADGEDGAQGPAWPRWSAGRPGADGEDGARPCCPAGLPVDPVPMV